MGNTHDDDEVEIDLRELFYALKKHILVILAAILAGAVIAGAATKREHPKVCVNLQTDVR